MVYPHSLGAISKQFSMLKPKYYFYIYKSDHVSALRFSHHINLSTFQKHFFLSFPLLYYFQFFSLTFLAVSSKYSLGEFFFLIKMEWLSIFLRPETKSFFMTFKALHGLSTCLASSPTSFPNSLNFSYFSLLFNLATTNLLQVSKSRMFSMMIWVFVVYISSLISHLSSYSCFRHIVIFSSSVLSKSFLPRDFHACLSPD